MGDFIKWFENIFYKDTIFRGGILTISLLLVVFIIIFIKFKPCFININENPICINSVIACTTVLHCIIHMFGELFAFISSLRPPDGCDLFRNEDRG